MSTARYYNPSDGRVYDLKYRGRKATSLRVNEGYELMHGWLLPPHLARLSQLYQELAGVEYVPPPSMSEEEAFRVSERLRTGAFNIQDVYERASPEDEPAALGSEAEPENPEAKLAEILREFEDEVRYDPEGPAAASAAEWLILLGQMTDDEWEAIRESAAAEKRERLNDFLDQLREAQEEDDLTQFLEEAAASLAPRDLGELVEAITVASEAPPDEEEGGASLVDRLKAIAQLIYTASRRGELPEELPVVPPLTMEDGAVLFLSTSPGTAPAAAVSAALENKASYTYYREYAVAIKGQLEWSAWENAPMRGGGIRGEPEEYVKDGRDISRGLVEHIENSFWRNVGYGEAMIGAFVPMEEPGDWEPMYHGEVNCFVRAALKHFTGAKKKKARRGHADPVETLMAFERAHHNSGVVPDDVWALEKPLGAKIRFFDVRGELLAQSDLPKEHRKCLDFVRHNGHCENKDEVPGFPALADRKGPMLTPLAPVYADGDDDHETFTLDDVYEQSERSESLFAGVQRRETAQILEYLAARNVTKDPSAMGRVWVVGREAIDGGGTIHRPATLNNELKAAALAEGEDEDAAALHVGGVQSWRFARWVQRSGISQAPAALVPVLEASQVEPRVWNVETSYELEGHYELDMRAAYLGCEDPDLGRAKSACEPYLRRFAMPGRGLAWAAVSDLSQVEAARGSFVRFASWQFAGPGYLTVYEEHLRRNGVMPTPLALALRDLGFLVSHRLSAVLTCYESAPALQFLDAQCRCEGPCEDRCKRRCEENKRLSHRFVGSCVKKPRNSLVVTDPAEAQYFYNILAKAGGRPRMTTVAGCSCIEYVDTRENVKYPHVRAYVLAYMHIAVLAKLKEHPDAVRVATDSLTVPGHAEMSAEPDKVPYGAWRVKTGPRAWNRCYYKPLVGALESGPPDEANLPPLPADLFTAPLTYYDGQGGAGKTTSAIRALSGWRVTVITKDWAGDIDATAKVEEAARAGCDTRGFTVDHYQRYWHLGYTGDKCEHSPACGKCLACVGWTPSLMGAASRRGALPDVIVWDEIGYVPPIHLRPILQYCLDKGVRVIAAADLLGQIRQYRDRGEGPPAAYQMLMEMGAASVFLDGDRRAKCPELRALKQRIWRSPESAQIAETVALLEARGRRGSAADALKKWHPRSHVLVSTKNEGSQIQKLLLEEHARCYRDHAVPMRFSPPREARKLHPPGSMVPVPGFLCDAEEEVPAIVGTRVWVDYDAAMRYLRTEKRPLWVYDGWQTVHRAQGLTLGCPTDEYDPDYAVIIVSWGLGADWNKNATYTAVSRAAHLDQLYWVD